MTKKKLLFTLLIVMIITMVTVPPTLAYFSTYVRVPGHKPVHVNEKVIIKEDGDTFKHVTLQADADSDPVYVRIAVFAPTEVESELVLEGDNWVENGIYHEFTKPLYAGETADITIKLKDENKIGREKFDLVVLYEYVPAQTKPDGSLYVDWTFKPEITKIGGAD